MAYLSDFCLGLYVRLPCQKPRAIIPMSRIQQARRAHCNKSFIINFWFISFPPLAGNIVDQVGEVKFLAFFVTQRVPSNDVRRTLKAFHERRMRQYGVQDIGIG